MGQSDFQERIRALEDRVALLEARSTPRLSEGQTPLAETPAGLPSSATASGVADRSRSIVGVNLLNKRFDPMSMNEFKLESNIWFDLKLTLSGDSRTTRAIKGTLVFSDLFGESHVLINYTLTDPLEPGIPRIVTGVGFEYNQFMSGHQWFAAQNIGDVVVFFEVSQILFQDGSTETLGQ